MQIRNVMFMPMANYENKNNTTTPSFGAIPVENCYKVWATAASAAAASAIAMLNSKNNVDLEALLENVNEFEDKLSNFSNEKNPQLSITELANLYNDAKIIERKLNSYKDNKDVKDAKQRVYSSMMFLGPNIIKMADKAAQKYTVSHTEDTKGEESDIVDFIFMNKDELEKSKNEVAELLDAYKMVNKYTDAREKLVKVQDYIDTSLELNLASKNFEEVKQILHNLHRKIREMEDGPQRDNYMNAEATIEHEAIVNNRWPDAHDLDSLFG